MSFIRLQIGALLGSLMLLAGCQAIEEEEAQTTEQLLAAAGFQMKVADTPERLAHLKTLTQLQLVPHDRDGQVNYVFADAEGCKCLYVGNESEYDAYQKLAVQQRIADEKREAAAENMDAAMDWGMWGPWGPY